jgi:hypothetical protein
VVVLAQKILEVMYRAISSADPNDLWRKSLQDAEITEIRILCDDYKRCLLGVFPDSEIACAIQAYDKNVFRMWKQISQASNQTRREVVIKKQLHSVGDEKVLLTISSKSETSENVCFRKVRKFVENFLLRHSGSQIFQNIVYRDPHTADARLTPSLSGFNGNDVLIIHCCDSKPRCPPQQGGEWR